MLANYVKVFRPACGFDPAEASLAQYVTIVGNPPGVAKSVEESLRSQGCRVERIAGSDAAETQRILEQMANQRRRFLNFDSAEPAMAPAVSRR
jgi:hypothetical protein